MSCVIATIGCQGAGACDQEDRRAKREAEQVEAFPPKPDNRRGAQRQQCGGEGYIQYRSHVIDLCGAVDPLLILVPDSYRSATNNQNGNRTCNVTAHLRRTRSEYPFHAQPQLTDLPLVRSLEEMAGFAIQL